jgi:hypothetical protein
MSDSRPFTSSRRARSDAPTLWHRRLARLVARRWGVQLEPKGNLSEGVLDGRVVAIRCAKSKTPPISVSASALERVHEVWGVFLTQTDAAQVYSLPAQEFKRLAYFYSPRKGQPVYTIRLKRFSSRATLVGTLGEEEVEQVEIP